MTIAAQDCETYSESGRHWDESVQKWQTLPGARLKGLPAIGAAAYSEHPSTEVLCWRYDLCDGRGVQFWRPGMPLPFDLFEHAAAGRPIESHNAMFEYLIWTNVCVPKYGWPPLPPHVQRCSMATARVQSLPGALDNLGDVLRLDTRKDKDGKRLLDKFSVPRNPTKGDPRLRIRPEDDPDDAMRLYEYCARDVQVEQAAADAMDPMTPAELGFWLIDQEINARGIGVDRAGVRDCIVILGQVLDQYGAECEALTGGLRPSQVEAMRGWLAAGGVHLSTLDVEAVEAALVRDDISPACRRVLEIRQLTASASVKKIYALENVTSRDDRIRNTIVHHGARTGRPTGGAGVQPLNLPKSGPKLIGCGVDKNGDVAPGSCGRPHRPDVASCPWCGVGTFYGAWGHLDDGVRPSWQTRYTDDVLEIMSCGSLAMVEHFFGDAMLCISGCVRGLFVAAEGHDLIASDYSAIEAVVLAMLAGEQWRIDAFRNREPIYLVGASKITGVPLATYLAYKEQHGDHHPDRQTIGKVSELACFTRQTQVLTDRGYVPIVAVKRDDRLWDGVEWVGHQGVVAKGTAETVRLDGVEMTPNHLINLNGSWKAAGLLVSSPRLTHLALATGSANLPSCGLFHPKKPSYNVRAGRTRISLRRPIYAKGGARVARRAAVNRQAFIKSSITGTRTYWPMASIAAVCSIESPLVSRAANRAVRQRRIEITQGAGSEFTNRGETAQRAVGRSSPILSRCPVGTFPRLSSTVSKPTAITSRAICSSARAKRTFKTSGQSSKCKNGSTPSRPSSSCTNEVYDIAFAGPRNRFTIKTDTGHLLVHNCGFGGWIGSYKAFGSTEDDETIRQQILAWRAASPAIVEFWGGQWRGPPWRREYAELYGVEGAFIRAIRCPDVRQDFRGIRFTYLSARDKLIITLPSGRDLTYHEPRLVQSGRNADEWSILYSTWNSNPKYGAMGWVRMSTYGGRLTENIVQAVAHDILRHAIIMLRVAGYPTVLHVYDEIVVEVPRGVGSLEQVETVMSSMPAWAADWPVSASGGWRGRRYRKG